HHYHRLDVMSDQLGAHVFGKSISVVLQDDQRTPFSDVEQEVVIFGKKQALIGKRIEVVAGYLGDDAHRVVRITDQTYQSARGFELGKQALGGFLQYVGLIE